MNNTIVQLEDPLNSPVKRAGRPTKVKKSSKTTKKKLINSLLNSNSLINSGYQSDVDTPDEKKVSKSKKKLLRKKRTPKLKISKPSKLPSIGKAGKSSKLSKRINFSKYLKNSSKTKKSTKRRLRNIENCLNLTSGYESDKEEESVIDNMPDLPKILLDTPMSLKVDKPITKSMSKSFMYHSKLQNGKLTEEGEYAINNNTKPYYIEGHIKDGKITEKMVRK